MLSRAARLDLLTPTQRAILSVLDVTPTTPRDLGHALGCPARVCLGYLWQLEREGWVEQRGKWWRIGPAGARISQPRPAIQCQARVVAKTALTR